MTLVLVGRLMSHRMEPILATQETAEPSSAAVVNVSGGPENEPRPVASAWHTVVVLVMLGILSYRGQVRLAQFRTLGDLSRVGLYERVIVTQWVMLGLVLFGVWLHGSSMYTVLGPRWRSPGSFLREFGIGMGFLVVAIMVGSILGHGGDRSITNLILPQGGRESWMWAALAVTAGICEETIYRGYLQRQFVAFTKSVPAGILVSAALFGAGHLYQGIGGALSIAVLGALAGALAHWCKSVRPGMIAHSLQDLLGAIVRH